VPSSEVPTGFATANVDLDQWNTAYWDKLAMATHPGDVSKAVVTNLMMATSVSV
jgi:hypothetical protein